MIRNMRMKALTGVGGAAALLALTVAPAFAATPTGNEMVTSPSSPFTVPVDSNGDPVDNQFPAVTGTGYQPGIVNIQVCDGLPESAPGWSPESDCDAVTATGQVPVTATGTFDFKGQGINNEVFAFRGLSPSGQFNCLAPQDNPNSTSTFNAAGFDPTSANGVNQVIIDPNEDAIDPTVPSYGASTVGKAGGSTAPCQLKIAYSNQTKSTSDQFISLVLPNTAATGPGTTVPESPLAIALPIGGVVLFGAAGALLYRKRRSTPTAA
jgi:hypothetical protein